MLSDKIGRRIEAIKSGTPERLDKAGRVLLQATIRSCSEPGSDDHHSRPGEAPLRQSGRLAASFRVQVSGNTLSLTNTAPYAAYLENGTSRMSPRDLKAGVDASKPEVKRIIFNP